MINIFISTYIFIILIILSYIDIKSRVVPLWSCALILAGGIVMLIIDREVYFHIKGLLFMFGISLIISLVTKGLGGGDVKLFASIGFTYGLEESLKIFILSFILSGVFIVISKIFILLIKLLPFKSSVFSKITGSKEIPFVPFIALSFCLIFIENLLYCL